MTPGRWVILTIRLAADDDGTVTATDTVSGASATVRSSISHADAASTALGLLGRQVERIHAGLAGSHAGLLPHEARRLQRLGNFYREAP